MLVGANDLFSLILCHLLIILRSIHNRFILIIIDIHTFRSCSSVSLDHIVKFSCCPFIDPLISPEVLDHAYEHM